MTWLLLTAAWCGTFSGGFLAGCWWVSAMHLGEERRRQLLREACQRADRDPS